MKAPAAGAFTTAEGRGRFEAQGLEWSRFGASMIQPALARSDKSPYCCQCWAARFDLDGFDRVFLPDQLRCAVEVLDANGNVLTRLGGYGNADDPGVALADPRSVMVTDQAAYIGDAANGRVLRVELGYRAKAGAPSTSLSARMLRRLTRTRRPSICQGCSRIRPRRCG